MNKFEIIPTPEWPEYDVKITLKPCFRCNHNCWFCEEYNNKTRLWTEDDCMLVLDKLQQLPTSKERIFFYFYGGEPTLCKHWEMLNYELVNRFPTRQLYIQTQTNLSVTANRLESFLQKITQQIDDSTTINICSSYHLGKQNVYEFIDKLKICQKYNALGLCFYSTEIPKKEQCISEFNTLVEEFGDIIKLRFTETEDLANRNIAGYEEYLNDDYLLGTDNGKSLEFRYWLREYPHWKKHFESGWNFDVDGETYNFSEVSGYNIHKKFKYMKCQCGTKGMVIDHDLQVYHCNDDYYNRINMTPIHELNLTTYLNRDVRCLNSACYDGLDYIKYRKQL